MAWADMLLSAASYGNLILRALQEKAERALSSLGLSYVIAFNLLLITSSIAPTTNKLCSISDRKHTAGINDLRAQSEVLFLRDIRQRCRGIDE